MGVGAHIRVHVCVRRAGTQLNEMQSFFSEAYFRMLLDSSGPSRITLLGAHTSILFLG